MKDKQIELAVTKGDLTKVQELLSLGQNIESISWVFRCRDKEKRIAIGLSEG